MQISINIDQKYISNYKEAISYVANEIKKAIDGKERSFIDEDEGNLSFYREILFDCTNAKTSVQNNDGLVSVHYLLSDFVENDKKENFSKLFVPATGVLFCFEFENTKTNDKRFFFRHDSCLVLDAQINNFLMHGGSLEKDERLTKVILAPLDHEDGLTIVDCIKKECLGIREEECIIL